MDEYRMEKGNFDLASENCVEKCFVFIQFETRWNRNYPDTFSFSKSSQCLPLCLNGISESRRHNMSIVELV